MKTLFLSTHELALSLSADHYTCGQLEALINKKIDGSSSYIIRTHSITASIVMRMLFQEQKEDRDFNKKNLSVDMSCALIEDWLGIEKCFHFQERREIRQRLISSLLIRPDRILCIPV